MLGFKKVEPKHVEHTKLDANVPSTINWVE